MRRKKWPARFLAALLALGLAGCGEDKQIQGLVVEVQADEAGNLCAFVVEMDGERTGVLLSEETHLWPSRSGSWSKQEAQAEFQENFHADTLAQAWCHPRREKLETAEGEKIPAYLAQSVSISGRLRRGVQVLSDGTKTDRLDNDAWGEHTYRLPDGTELLRISDSSGPEDYYLEGLGSLDGLSEAAQEAILAYYAAQGPLYDEEEELEKSYAAYRQLGEEFSADRISQDISPCAFNDTLVYFLTEAHLPAKRGQRVMSVIQLCAAFNRRTGERVDSRDLFGVPEEEVRRLLPELGGPEDPALRAEMAQALDLAQIVFRSESAEVVFQANTLPSGEPDCGYAAGVRYEDAPEGFFQPWAIPDS